MNILITGGKGFIGHNLTKFLNQKQNNITVIDDNRRKSPSYKKIKGVEYLDISIERVDLDDVLSFKKIDIVIHLAATVSVDECENRPSYSFNNNVTNTLKVIESVKRNNIKNFIFASTAAVYLKNKNIYGNTKYISEELIKYLLSGSNTTTTILRFFNVYGPGAHYEGAYSPVVEKFLHLKKNNLPLTLYKPCTHTRDFIHIDDICELVYAIIYSSKKYDVKIFDVCSGISIKIKTLADAISKNQIFVDGRENEVIKSFSTDNKKVEKYFKWKPKHNILTYIKNQL
jgi:UDP-glucose 4-epimerase